MSKKKELTAEQIEKLQFKEKSGAKAAAFNLILPGLGYIYCGRVILGIIVFPFVAAMLFFVHWGGAIFLWVILIVDGFLAAGRYNKKIEKKIQESMKKCPQCAEKIMPDAKVCKHCGYKFEVSSESGTT